jgi:hypothetical protein
VYLQTAETGRKRELRIREEAGLRQPYQTRTNSQERPEGGSPKAPTCFFVCPLPFLVLTLLSISFLGSLFFLFSQCFHSDDFFLTFYRSRTRPARYSFRLLPLRRRVTCIRVWAARRGIGAAWGGNIQPSRLVTTAFSQNARSPISSAIWCPYLGSGAGARS